jgi:hypothetical protein
VEDYGFNLDPNHKTIREKMGFREGLKYFLDGFMDMDYYESNGAIAFVIFALTPIIVLIALIVNWLRS